MKKARVEILGTITPIVPYVGITEKVQFLHHELRLCETDSDDCTGCFFNDPWICCDHIRCLKSNRKDGLRVIYRETLPPLP